MRTIYFKCRLSNKLVNKPYYVVITFIIIGYSILYKQSRVKLI
jgi:hypothetical protein